MSPIRVRARVDVGGLAVTAICALAVFVFALAIARAVIAAI